MSEELFAAILNQWRDRYPAEVAHCTRDPAELARVEAQILARVDTLMDNDQRFWEKVGQAPPEELRREVAKAAVMIAVEEELQAQQRDTMLRRAR